MTPIKLHTETPPPHSLLACKCVVYRWTDGRKYRCSERAWEQTVIELIESGAVNKLLWKAAMKAKPIEVKEKQP